MTDCGRVLQINVSQGGVPKRSIDRADVDPGSGISVDDQADRVHHGGPLQDLCLFRLETLLELQQEGHPIYPGAAGENLTVAGFPLELFAPGGRFRVGDEVEFELTEYATPCSNLKNYFIDEKVSRISQKTHPESARMYARVLIGGTISAGDPILLVRG